jgi:hypothetical protein
MQKQQFYLIASWIYKNSNETIIGFTKVIMNDENKQMNTLIKLSGDAFCTDRWHSRFAKVDSGKWHLRKSKSTVSVMLQLFEPKILEKLYN